MTYPTLTPGPTHSIGTVSRLTGVKPDTLRIWERRYGLGAANKSEAGQRIYTQTELEHLQIVSSLVQQGYRIGDIAEQERKTLTAMQDREKAPSDSHPDDARPNLLVIGDKVCDWLTRHQGCLQSVEATFHRGSIDTNTLPDPTSIPDYDLMMIEVTQLDRAKLLQIQAFHQDVGAIPTILLCDNLPADGTTGSKNKNLIMEQSLLDTHTFATHMKQLLTLQELSSSRSITNRFGRPQPRLFDAEALGDITGEMADLNCNCPDHLTTLIDELASFEDYSSNCATENWQDAATHACVYAYANQARWLIEKALEIVIEGHNTTAA